MLKSYEAIYEQGQMKWLADQPQVTSARVIVTILEENPLPVKRRISPNSLAGKAQILGDIVGSIVNEEDWKCLK
ncbi:conserved hypothetical protein [Planktothrix sp. PCC 11201]|uniref:hypothetical protein n=1 Tax=Planktothrix sp. PCC 11201 TaxID=1729650 RepID=UPI000918B177|nr:hypothetical protein [Planktothrix sp. PCC 11201]SKB11322.1 conserved hypothetical protein [Planktothrix sp. PCC 11201]